MIQEIILKSIGEIDHEIETTRKLIEKTKEGIMELEEADHYLHNELHELLKAKSRLERKWDDMERELYDPDHRLFPRPEDVHRTI